MCKHALRLLRVIMQRVFSNRECSRLATTLNLKQLLNSTVGAIIYLRCYGVYSSASLPPTESTLPFGSSVAVRLVACNKEPVDTQVFVEGS